jgi:Tfp pilus assembly pilus retraction ATPase PilT
MFRQPEPRAHEPEWEWAERPSGAPTELADIPRIIDLYGYLSRGPAGHGRVIPRGRGAYCYYGPSTLSHVGGTPIEGWVDDLYDYIEQTYNTDAEDFRVTYDGFSWRACREANDYGVHLSLRSLASSTPCIEDLSIGNAGLKTLLLSDLLREGLVVFCGLTGQGKTTLAGGTIRSRLERRGGRCASIEDVLEMPLEGIWGSGSCRQLQVDRGDPTSLRSGFAGAARRAYRVLPATRPAILYVGEVRDTETAVEAVKAAANGMSVITTIHAGDITSAVMRLANLAKPVMGADGALESIAQGLRLVAHSRLDLSPTTTGWKRGSFKVSALVSQDYTSPAANAIRTGKWTALSQPIDHQARAFSRMVYASPPTEEDLLAQLSAMGGNP